MKTNHQSVVFVSSNTNGRYTAFCDLADRVGFQPIHSKTISELFKILNSSEYNVDLILFDIDTLYNPDDANVLDIINTVSTLSKCSQAQNQPILSVVTNDSTDPATIRDAMTTDIKGFIAKFDFDKVDDNIFALKELLAGKSFTDKAIIEKIKPTKRNSQKKYNVRVNGIDLTIRQEQILKLICDRGASNKQIARLLNLSESTIKLHIGAILRKYGLRNRTQLALFAKSHYTKK